MTQPFPEPLHFDRPEGSDSSQIPDLLDGRRGIVAVLVAPEAHASGWASRTAVALAEASLAAGCPTGLVDLALENPRLHTAANIDAVEGLTDIILFGASLGRVSRWSSAGARVIAAGTLVGTVDEILSESSWADVARAASDGGCVLAYAPVESAEAVLAQTSEVILLRHEGEQVEGLSVTPTLVLEPLPVVPEEPPGDEADGVAENTPQPIEEDLSAKAAEVEVTVDLDDVVDDGDEGGAPMFAPPIDAPVRSDAEEDVQGLDVEPEWPAFDVPLVVQDPGEVDPLVAAAGQEAVETLDDSVFDDITTGGAEVLIVSDDLGMGPPADVTDEVVGPAMDGLVDSGLDTLSPAGGTASESADQVSGLEVSPTEPPPIEPSPTETPLTESPLAETPLAETPLAETPLAETPSWEGDLDLDVDLGSDGPSLGPLDPADAQNPASPEVDAFDRLDDPWGEPPEPSLDAQAQEPPSAAPAESLSEVAETEGPNPFDFEPGQGDPLPWEQAADVPAAPAEPDEVPVAQVTRTRTRTRTKGPRPFLLILFLLLISIVAVLQWLGMLDVAGLDFLRGDGF